ncbi:MAG TPA: MarR family transcriptional regulator [Ferrovibrio sp.]|uniref:MarR family winged helix-turn-helix transcriptional regulator n=1 Tax=Ferrovibrio sp. TaxID=1917215 RepID=UPI002ED1D9D9
MSEARPMPQPANDRETAVSRDDKLELRLWLRLLTCSNLIERNVRSALREKFDTTLPRFDLLAQLDRAPDGLTMSELSARMMVSNGNITGLTDRLVEEGLVRRTPSARDRRSSHVGLTPAGKKAFDAMTPEHEAWIDTMMAGLSRQEMQQLFQLLGKLKASVLENLGDRGAEP